MCSQLFSLFWHCFVKKKSAFSLLNAIGNMQSKEKKKVDTLQRKGRAESEHESKMRGFFPPFYKNS